MGRKFVKQATSEGFYQAISPGIAHHFSIESTDIGPAILFTGIGQVSKTISQDTWFEFNEDASQVKYVVRLVNVDSDSESYGEAISTMGTLLSLEDAADLFDMCVSQARAAESLVRRAQAEESFSKRDN